MIGAKGFSLAFFFGVECARLDVLFDSNKCQPFLSTKHIAPQQREGMQSDDIYELVHTLFFAILGKNPDLNRIYIWQDLLGG